MADLSRACRDRFPILGRRVYVNSCAQGALSDAVRCAYETYLDDWDEHGSPWDVWVGKLDEARTALVGAPRDEVVVTTSVSAAVNAFASGLEFGERSKVVLTDLEFPTIGQIWHAQERRGARVVHVGPDADGVVTVERLAAEIDDDTLLVSVPHVSYRTGARIDVAAVLAGLAKHRSLLA